MNDNYFLKSALTLDNPFNNLDEILSWVGRKKNEVYVDIQETKLSDLRDWKYDSKENNLAHTSGRYFTVDGIRVSTNWGIINQWEQPIIVQPEIGILGIIVKEFDGVPLFLMQNKIEPGNINKVQISPTLQATKSNYSQVHGGRKPQYSEYFLNHKNEILLDQLQSEQGARFLKKRNRNIIIRIYTDIEFNDNYRWITLGQLLELVNRGNLVNMDTRTIISSISYAVGEEEIKLITQKSNISKVGIEYLKSVSDDLKSINHIDSILAWMAGLKSIYELDVKKIDLRKVKDWIYTDEAIYHKEHKYFSVIPVTVVINNREVSSWCQPMIKPTQEGICAFIVKKINGVLHFLVQAKLECGNFDIIEMAPTVQCLTGNYRDPAVVKPLFLDYVLNIPEQNVLYDCYQSEEGGRFYKEQNRNMIVLANNDFDENVPFNYKWLTLSQIKLFLKFHNYLNIQARSLISALKFL